MDSSDENRRSMNRSADKNQILILSFSDLKNDPRVYRQIRFLKDRYHVTAAGLGNPDVEDVAYYPITHNLPSIFLKAKWAISSKTKSFDRLRSYQQDVWHFPPDLREKRFDLIVANEIDLLPFVDWLWPETKVILDAHEYSPREHEDSFFWRFFVRGFREYLCRKYMNRCERVMTVSEGIAREYEVNFGIRPVVITNAAEYEDMEPSPVKDGIVRLIHHGNATRSRKIEAMIEMMADLDGRFSLDLMLMPTDRRYLQELKRRSQRVANVRLRDPVPMQQIVRSINAYDVGIFLLEPTTFNFKHVLPNKLFEFIQARLAVAIGPSIEMADIVRHADCGVIAPDFTPRSMAKTLSGLTRDKLECYKKQSHKAAYLLSSQPNMERLGQLVEEVLAS